jgi:hypothetical protein
MKKLKIAGLTAVFSIFFISCSSSRVPVEASKTQAETVFEKYSSTVATAEKLADKDEFDKLFRAEKTITLKGEDIKNLNQFRVGRDGGIYVCDYDRKSVMLFDSSGSHKKILGKPGNAPGSHVFPTSVVEAKESALAITDFQGHRVNVFSNDGSFASSFIYTPQKFSAQNIVFNETNDSYYLFGNRWQENESGDVTGADLIHKYSSKGKYLASYLQFPDEFKTLNLYNYSFPAVDSDGGTIYMRGRGVFIR